MSKTFTLYPPNSASQQIRKSKIVRCSGEEKVRLGVINFALQSNSNYKWQSQVLKPRPRSSKPIFFSIVGQQLLANGVSYGHFSELSNSSKQAWGLGLQLFVKCTEEYGLSELQKGYWRRLHNWSLKVEPLWKFSEVFNNSHECDIVQEMGPTG